MLQSVERYEIAQKRLFDVLQADFKGQQMPTDDATVQPPMVLSPKDVATQNATPKAAPAATPVPVPANSQ